MYLNNDGMTEEVYDIIRLSVGMESAVKQVTYFNNKSEEYFLSQVSVGAKFRATPMIMFVPPEKMTEEIKKQALLNYHIPDILKYVSKNFIDYNGSACEMSSDLWEIVIDKEDGFSSLFVRFYRGDDINLFRKFVNKHIVTFPHLGNVPHKMLKELASEIYETINHVDGARKLFNATDDRVIKTYLKLKFAI